MNSSSIFFPIMALFLAGTSTTAIAETFSYTFISADYEVFQEDIDNASEDLEGDGINLNFGINVAPNFAIIGSYGESKADVTEGNLEVDADIDSASLGVLYHMSVSEVVDVFATAQVIKGNFQLEVNGNKQPEEDADGGSISAGARWMVQENLEVNGSVEYSDIEDEDSTEFSVGAAYYLSKTFALDAQLSSSGDGDSVRIGGTLYF